MVGTLTLLRSLWYILQAKLQANISYVTTEDQ